ncbi:hypothetical protein [Swingsia samuiensis]|uniref:Uncharacterized protein n=1 Tax=Swingsia samuiensis TaxID=1293412 RepID=A0A4Y6UG35_9PROT|nr:hypothetical protein [Swingsia samuiensis]QDH16509.1 hypothetical protein E3D00_02165 [Swingsia samuiensis]
MSAVPPNDTTMIFMSPAQFQALSAIEGQNSLDPIWKLGSGVGNPAPSIARRVDQGNEWLKDKTNIDMFGWRDAISSGKSAAKQIWFLGLSATFLFTTTKTGKEVVIVKGPLSLRDRVYQTLSIKVKEGSFNRDALFDEKTLVQEMGLVIGRAEMLKEAAKGVKVAVVCLIAMDVVHECLQDKFDMTRLGVTILSDVVQAVLGTAAGVVVGSVLIAGGAPVVLTCCLVSATCVYAGYKLSQWDSQYKITEKAIAIAKEVEVNNPIESAIEYVEDLGADYKEFVTHPGVYFEYLYWKNVLKVRA